MVSKLREHTVGVKVHGRALLNPALVCEKTITNEHTCAVYILHALPRHKQKYSHEMKTDQVLH